MRYVGKLRSNVLVRRRFVPQGGLSGLHRVET